MTLGTGFSQSSNDWNFGGLVRLRPLATFFGLVAGGFEIVADWVPYVSPNIGIPLEIDFASIGGITGFGIMTGIEAVPLRHKEKSGLYLTAVGGPLFIARNVGFSARTDIGYQLVSDTGFVFTPAIGAKYIYLSGKLDIGFDFMLDMGFAYKRWKR